MFRYVNRPVKRVDALAKVTGKALYAEDISFPGMLYGAVLRAEHPHAKVLKINTARAKRIRGVRAVITAEDIPGSKLVGSVKLDQPVLAIDRVRYIGDGIAAVAAEDMDTARRALLTIEVDYEVLPGVFDPEEALRDDAPKVHEDGNIIVYHKVRKGDVEKGFKEADLIIEREYKTQFIEHSYIEPEAVVARPVDYGGIEIWGCIQNAFTTQKNVARVLGLDMAKVRIIQTPLGGSFGGKDDVMTVMAARAALLALKTGRPVKLVNTREESMRESYKRHPYVLRYKLGLKRDGTIVALQAYMVADGGAYASTTSFVTWRSTVQAAGPYRVPHVKVDTYGVYTNNPYTGAMRGFGSPQANFAIESLMDEAAHELGMDPIEFRLKNGLRDGDETATGQKLTRHRVSLHEVIEKVRDAINWEELRKNPGGDGKIRRGVGIACSFRGASLGAEGVDIAGVEVKIDSDASVSIEAGLTEMGQGIKTVLAQVVAEELGAPIERVTLHPYDTSRVPDSGPTVASRATIVGGGAAQAACRKLREIILDALREEDGTEKAWFEDGVYRTGKNDYSFEEAVGIAIRRGRGLNAVGWFRSPDIHWDEEKGIGSPYFTYVYGAQAAYVEVDTETGKVKVLRVAAAHEVGRAINPAMARGQIYGGVAMALGYGLLEEFEVSEGIPLVKNFDDYSIPSSLDVPEVIPIIVENPDPDGPFGAKSLGEPTNELLAPAIANAIFHATGKRLRELPMNLEMVLLGRKLRRKRK